MTLPTVTPIATKSYAPPMKSQTLSAVMAEVVDVAVDAGRSTAGTNFPSKSVSTLGLTFGFEPKIKLYTFDAPEVMELSLARRAGPMPPKSMADFANSAAL